MSLPSTRSEFNDQNAYDNKIQGQKIEIVMNVRKVHSIDRKALYCQAQITGIFSPERKYGLQNYQN